MKTVLISALVAAGVLASAPAFANKELAIKKNCFSACHAVDKMVVGPAYQDVAKKYTAKDEAMLVQNVLKGTAPAGKGWQKAGKAKLPFMPANPGVSAEEAKILVKWILGGAK